MLRDLAFPGKKLVAGEAGATVVRLESTDALRRDDSEEVSPELRVAV